MIVGGIAMPRQFSLANSHLCEGHSISAQSFPSQSGEKQQFTPLLRVLGDQIRFAIKKLPALASMRHWKHCPLGSGGLGSCKICL